MRGKHSNIMNIYMYIFGPYPLEVDWLVFIIGPVIDFFLRTFPPSATCTMIVFCAWNYFVVSYVALKHLLVLIAGVWSFVNKQDQNLKKNVHPPLLYSPASPYHTTHQRKHGNELYKSNLKKNIFCCKPGKFNESFRHWNVCTFKIVLFK